jgi:hypothetical protein
MEKAKKVLAAITIFLFCVGCHAESYYYRCYDAQSVDAKERADIATTSLQFAKAIFSADIAAAYDQFTEEWKKSTGREQLAAYLESLKLSGPYSDPHVDQVMTVTGSGDLSEGNSIADCAKDRTRSETNVMVQIKKIREQAYTIVSAKSSQGTWIAVLWLIPRSGKWQVQAVYTTMKSASGKEASDILALARSEKSYGHLLNAGVLYSGAASLAARGPFYHTAFQDLIQEEAQQVTPPPEFRGNPPFVLKGAAGQLSIVRVSPNTVNGKLFMVITHEVPPWKDTREAEMVNRALISTFARKFPEYSHAFAGLVAEAMERNSSRGWSTVEENAEITSHK